METHSAVAAVENGKVTVWPGTQTPFPRQEPADAGAAAAGRQGAGGHPVRRRRLRRQVGASRQAVEAARLAMLTGKPVRVVWSREEEFFYDTFRPAAVISIRSGLDAAKRIAFWDYTVYAAGERGAAQFYDIPHHRTVARGGWGGGGAGRLPSLRDRAVAGPGSEHQRLRARVAHRRAGGEGGRRPGRVPAEAPEGSAR